MIDQTQSNPARKKTPEDASEFEREQLRFFLSGDDLAATLATVNPSLAWLPVLSEMKLLENDIQLIAWVERNFSDVDAVRDVVNNLHFFGPQAANFLEFRLNGQAGSLPPLLAKSWQLIIRHMRTSKRGLAQNEWFEIAPQLKRGEHSAELLERLANALRPKLKLSKRLSWYDTEGRTPERPTDLTIALTLVLRPVSRPGNFLAHSNNWVKNMIASRHRLAAQTDGPTPDLRKTPDHG
jgi:hypothetical protein